MVSHSNISSDRLSHAYIVSGGLAEALAMSAVCAGPEAARPCGSCTHCAKASRGAHPDIMVVEKAPDKREIVVDQIRALKRDVIVVPNEAGKKAYIVNEADSMNKNAQNAFLQILEEPPSHAVLILRTENPAALLPTVRSRCVEIKSRALAGTVMEAAPPAVGAEMARELFDSLSSGNAALVSLMFRLEKLDKDTFSQFLSAAREQAAIRLRETGSGGSEQRSAERDAMRELLARAERVLVEAGDMLDLNVGTGHLSGMICANLIRISAVPSGKR